VGRQGFSAALHHRSSDNGTQSPGARSYRQAVHPSEAFFVTAWAAPGSEAMIRPHG